VALVPNETSFEVSFFFFIPSTDCY
jgi:hypothetical protein